MHSNKSKPKEETNEKENHQRVANAVLHGKHELHKRVEIVEIPHESLRSLGILE